jgi:hypothetical protein
MRIYREANDFRRCRSGSAIRCPAICAPRICVRSEESGPDTDIELEGNGVLEQTANPRDMLVPPMELRVR